MSITIESESAIALLAVVEGLLDKLLGKLAASSVWAVSNADALELVTAGAAVAAKVAAVKLRAIREVDARGLALADGAPSTAAWVRGHCRERMGLATRQVRLAHALSEEWAATGEALAAGSISVDQAHVVAQALSEVPQAVDEATVSAAESDLLDCARTMDPTDLAKVGRALAFCLDPDGADAMAREEARLVDRRELFLSKTDTGYWLLRGRLGPEQGAEFSVLLDALSKPRPSNAEGPDLRTAALRRADGLADIVALAHSADGVPSAGGHQPMVIVQVPWATLHGVPGAGPATFGDGSPLSPEAARRLACDAKILPMVLGSKSQPTDLGRASYAPTLGLRLAVLVRDQYRCQTPYCGNVPRHIHHIQHWADGGLTDLDNLVALCGHCHRLIHSSRNIWAISAVPGGSPRFARTGPAP
jgi:Domain of unknown function (DUF222)/HNH endonuclease